MKRLSVHIFLSCLVLVVVMSSCKRDHNDRGLEFAPQMYVSKPYEPYTQTKANPINPHGMNVRLPAPGTIARRKFNTVFTTEDSTGKMTKTVDLMMYDHIAPTDYDRAAAELKSPFPHSPEVIAQGQVLYTRVCTPCHGAQGDGKGSVAAMYKGVANLKGSAYTILPEGHIFHVITHGKGRMWPHGSQLSPEERWKIVHYVFELQGRGASEETPENEEAAPTEENAG